MTVQRPVSVCRDISIHAAESKEGQNMLKSEMLMEDRACGAKLRNEEALLSDDDLLVTPPGLVHGLSSTCNFSNY
jgi:hypothetical protein